MTLFIIILQFRTILFPYKLRVNEKRTHVNKGCNLENPYVIMVFNAVPSLLSHTKCLMILLGIFKNLLFLFVSRSVWKMLKISEKTSIRFDTRRTFSNFSHFEGAISTFWIIIRTKTKTMWPNMPLFEVWLRKQSKMFSPTKKRGSIATNLFYPTLCQPVITKFLKKMKTVQKIPDQVHTRYYMYLILLNFYCFSMFKISIFV